MLEYVLHPRPGYSLEEAVENPNFDNCVILEIWNGFPTVFYPVTRDTLNRLKPKPPRAYYQYKERIRFGEQTKSLMKGYEDGRLQTEINPFVQLILYAVIRAEDVREGIVGARIEDIYRFLIEEKRVMPNEPSSYWKIKKIVEYMLKMGWLVYVRGRYAKGITPRGGDPLIEWREGYDPFEDQIMKFVERGGRVSKGEIKDFVLTYLRWTKNPDLVDYYLHRLVKKGNLKEYRGDKKEGGRWYTVEAPLQPF